MPIPYLSEQQLIEQCPLGSPGGIFKFVRVDNCYRFIEITCWTPRHSDIVDKTKESPQSAGMLSIGPEHWEMKDTYSTTLMIGVTAVDYECISNLLGRPLR